MSKAFRNVEKLREDFNVRDYGAVGNGVVNDTLAIQAAWNAAKAKGGGVLYFPFGKYRCNVIGLGSDGVSIRGDGVSSIIVSHAPNDWAVKYDGGFPQACIFIENVQFWDETNAQTTHGLYINTGTGVAIQNVQFRGLGIGLCNNATWGFNIISCKFNGNYCDIFSTASVGVGTSIQNVNGQTVQITNAFFPQHPGIMLVQDCKWFNSKIHHYFEQPDSGFIAESALHYVSCVSSPTGCGFYYDQPTWVHNISMDQMWMEGSPAPVQFRGKTLPGVYVYSNANNIDIKNSFVGSIELTGLCACTLTNCQTNETQSFTATAPASFIGKNFVGDGDGGLYLPFFIDGARAATAAGRGVYFHTSAKTNINRIYTGKKVASNRCFSGDTLFPAFGGTVTHSTADSAFETLESFQIVANTNNGAYPLGAITFNPAKIYVFTVAAKGVSSGIIMQFSTGLGNKTFTLPTDQFQTYAVVGTNNTTFSPLLLNQAGTSKTWLISGVQCLAFDNYSQVYEFLASSSFTL